MFAPCFLSAILGQIHSCDHIFITTNISLKEIKATTSSSKKNLPPMSLNSPTRFFSSSMLSNFPSANASTVINAEKERM